MTQARRLGGLLMLLALAACASAPTPYGPATGDLGYRDQQIESNRYRVSFAGNAATPRDKVENYALYRAAELTIASGNDYFKIASRNTDARSGGSGGPSIGVGVGGGTGGLGIGLSSILGSGGGYAAGNYTVSMDILVFQGTKPPDDRDAYDAREVVRRLEGAIERPPE